MTFEIYDKIVQCMSAKYKYTALHWLVNYGRSSNITVTFSDTAVSADKTPSYWAYDNTFVKLIWTFQALIF